MSKYSDVKLIELFDDYETAFLMKGERTPAEMEKAVREQHGWPDYEFSDRDHIQTRVYRWIPTPPGRDAWYDYYLHPSKPGRGAFLATLLSIAV